MNPSRPELRIVQVGHGSVKMQWGDDTVLTAAVSSSPSRDAEVARKRGLMLDFFNKLDVGDLSAFDLFDPGFEHHNRLPGAANDSREEARRAFGTLHEAAPDMRHDLSGRANPATPVRRMPTGRDTSARACIRLRQAALSAAPRPLVMKRSPPTDLVALQAFVQIVDNGSLSAAERALGIPKATLSRRLSDLERELRTPLLRRTTRAHSLIPAGQSLYDRVAPLIAEAERAATDIHVASKEPSGLVRVSAALGFGQMVLMPILARFLADLPKVRVDLALTDDSVRIVDAGFDLAIRMGPLDESDLVSRRLARIDRSVVASPTYITAHGAPKSLAELAAHVILIRDPHHETWRFDGDNGPHDVRVNWRVSTGGMTNLVEGARLGMGIAMVPTYMAEPFLATRELVALELGATPTTAYATALFPRSPTRSAAVRALLDRIVADLSRHPTFSPRKGRPRGEAPR